MDTERPAQQQKALLEHIGQVRQLARCLVSDPNLADDILQDVYLLAMERPPQRANGTAERWAWLRQVTRTLARQHYRSEQRRKRREHQASRSEGTPSFLAPMLAKEKANDIRGVLLDLPEPYGSSVRMRILEGMQPIEIARILGTNSATIRMRITRGIRKAQATLSASSSQPADKEHLGAFGVSLLGLLERKLRGALRSTLAWTTIGCVALVVVTGAYRLPAKQHSSAVAVAETIDAVDPLRNAPNFPDRRAMQPPVRSSSQTHPEETSEVNLETLVAGTVLWANGEPAAQIAVQIAPEPSMLQTATQVVRTITTDNHGRFAFHASLPEDGVVWITSQGRDHVTLLQGAVDKQSLLGEPTIVVARTTEMSGVVLNAHGLPQAFAEVAWAAPINLSQKLPISTTFTRPASIGFETDAKGRFQGAHVPSIEDAKLIVSVPGSEAWEWPMEWPAVNQVTIEREARSDAFLVQGRVTDMQGKPLQTATVCMGSKMTATRDDGSFSISVPSDPQPGSMVFAKPGFESQRMPLLVTNATLNSSWREVRLQAGRPVVRGRITDSNGLPLPGILVMPTQLEAAAQLQAEIWTIEGLCTLQAVPQPARATTDAQGRFELHGLQAHTYKLLVVDPTNLHSQRSVLEAGRNSAQFVFESQASLAQVAGTIQNRLGEPILNASIWMIKPATEIILAGQVLKTTNVIGPAVRADARGRFNLFNVPLDAFLQVEAPGHIPQRVPTDAQVVVSLATSCQLQIQQAPVAAKNVRILDGENNPLPCIQFDASEIGTETTLEPIQLNGHSTPVLLIPLHAVRAEFLDRQGHSLGFMALQLESTAVNILSAGHL